MSNSLKPLQIKRFNRPEWSGDAGVLTYDSERNCYFVDPSKVAWQKWFPLEIRFRHLLNAWPFVYGKVLEIGCGTRPFRLLFERLSEHYVGFDFRGGAARGCGGVIVQENALPLQSESLETIMGIDVLRKVENPHAFLKQIYRALRTNGHLILWISHGSSLLLDDDVSYNFSPGSLHALIESLGLQIEYESTLIGKGAAFIQNGVKFLSSERFFKYRKSLISGILIPIQKFYLKHVERDHYHSGARGERLNFPLLNGGRISTLIVGRKL
ncbi:methyltransferase domain protein [bacterium BMS3Abin05]|nr:methyltransferase domain protein [bacterium BMS3Abin05]GBE26713.1 methyltransferase domain protein [bacterium BMS3Bbin03]